MSDIKVTLDYTAIAQQIKTIKYFLKKIEDRLDQAAVDANPTEKENKIK